MPQGLLLLRIVLVLLHAEDAALVLTIRWPSVWAAKYHQLGGR